MSCRPAKKKGYGCLLGLDAGPATDEIMSSALDQSLFGSDGEPCDPDLMDGFGAISGAIDQLAFTHDLDFSGDGVDDDPLKSQVKGQAQKTQASTSNHLAVPEKKKKKKQRESDGYDNPAFLDNEELLLAATLGGGESDDSDTDMLESRRLAQPRIIIRAETEVATSTAMLATVPAVGGKASGPATSKHIKTTSKGSATDVSLIARPRLPSAKMRRIGSARKTPARFAMTFTEKYDPVSKVATGAVLKAPDQPPTLETTPKTDESDTKKKHIKGGKKTEETSTQKAQSLEIGAEDSDKWAEKKPRCNKNKVAPSSSSEESEPVADARTQDDLSVGLQSGSDTTREEVKAKDKERPKTSVASQKMKNRATDNVGNMNSILPWDNEDGDIK